MAQLMPLPFTVSCFTKILIGFTFWYWLSRVVPEKGPLHVCVCVMQNKSFKGIGHLPSGHEIKPSTFISWPQKYTDDVKIK